MRILKTAFGDYMTPPPIEKQVAHHDALLLDLDRSYREYHGDYKCKIRKKVLFYLLVIFAWRRSRKDPCYYS